MKRPDSVPAITSTMNDKLATRLERAIDRLVDAAELPAGHDVVDPTKVRGQPPLPPPPAWPIVPEAGEDEGPLL
jgi:hypothetical protein